MVADSTSTGFGRARWLGLTLLLLAVVVGIAGCQGGFGHDYVVQIQRTFDRRDPIAILDSSTSGEERAWAISNIKEPLQHGGSQDEQGKVVAILRLLATGDREPLCRLQAIRTLSRFKDRSAADALHEAYFKATTFPAEMNAMIRQQALAALAETGAPNARDLLIQVAKAGAREVDLAERQQTIDLRLTAIRGLARYPHFEATTTLLYILEHEKDAAMRERAHESLQTATGKRLPPDAQKWSELLYSSQPPPPREERGILPALFTGSKARAPQDSPKAPNEQPNPGLPPATPPARPQS